MYKRRKVFSKIGEKTYSTTEFQTQKEFAEKKKSTEKIDGESKKEKALKKPLKPASLNRTLLTLPPASAEW